jgi:WD repeat-containing protein 76
MAPAKTAELSEYERKRQETIAKNQALLRDLALNAAQAGLAPKKKRASSSAAQNKSRPAPKPKEPPVPTRSSARLQGLVADSEVAKRKADQEVEAQQASERAKRRRVSGDLQVSDILVSGKYSDTNAVNFFTAVGPAKPYERTFTAQDIRKTTDKELRNLRERMSSLQLWEDVEPNSIKITPERIYAMAFHPTTEKALIFAGDKLGNMGIFDSSQSSPIKSEDDEEDGEFDPQITNLKLHSRTVSAFQMSLTDSNSLFSSSYDSTIRRLDLRKGIAVEIYAPEDQFAEEPLSGVQLSSQDAHMVYFTTLEGHFGMHDMRTAAQGSGTQTFALSDKKIGGFSLHPTNPHIVATASLDRTLKIWDLRQISGRGDNRVPALIGEHESKLSVSHAAFNYAGQVATASYDDTIKIHDFSSAGTWNPGHKLTDTEMAPKTIIRHNNQTGRWVTM